MTIQVLWQPFLHHWSEIIWGFNHLLRPWPAAKLNKWITKCVCWMFMICSNNVHDNRLKNENMSLWYTKQIRSLILVSMCVYSCINNKISMLALAVYLQEEEENICDMSTYHTLVQIRLHVWGPGAPSDHHSWSAQWHVNASCSLCSHRLSPGSHLPPKVERHRYLPSPLIMIFEPHKEEKPYYASQRWTGGTTVILRWEKNWFNILRPTG